MVKIDKNEKTFLWSMFFKLIQFGFNLLAKKHGVDKVKVEIQSLKSEIEAKHNL